MPIINIPQIRNYETKAGAQAKVDAALQQAKTDAQAKADTALQQAKTDAQAKADTALQKAKTWGSETFRNDNLLMNTNFRNPVNQRSFTQVTGGYAYTIDRWRNIQANLRITGDGFLATGSPTQLNGGVYQLMEDKSMIGSTVTVSAKVNGSIYSYSAKFPTESYIQSPYLTGKFAFRIGVSGEFPYIGLLVTDSSQYRLEWAKLEYGSVVTPFVARSYQEELAACKWYMERIGNSRSVRLTDATFVPAGALCMKLDLHYAPKRMVPTIKLSDLSQYRLLVEYINKGQTSIALTDSRISGVVIDFTYDGNGGTVKINLTETLNTIDAYVTLQRTDNATAAWIDVDAEIY